MSPSSVSPTVAVVGGGLAGLTAALELARGGLDVTVFEQADDVGGRGRSREVQGFLFNMGPHALYAGGAACRILAANGVPVKGHRPPLRGGKSLVGGGIDLLPVDATSMLRAKWLSWGAKLQVLRFFTRMLKIDPVAWQGKTADEWLRAQVSRPEARRLFTALLSLTTYSADPGRLDAVTAIRQLQLGFDSGVLYLDGGWQTLVRGLEERARELGVRFVTQGRVRAVRRLGEGWQVTVGDAPSEVDAVILAVGPDQVRGLLAAEMPSSLASSLAALEPVDAACLDVALRRLPNPKRLFALGIDQPYYVSVHSATAALAPEGGALIHVLRYLDGAAATRREDIEQELEGLLDQLQPGWRPLVVERQLMPKMRVCHALHDFGVARPAGQVDALPGLHLAGDWVGDEGLLADAAVASGSQAAQQILARGGARRAAA